MIKCVIDGSICYPELKNKIKVTYANPYVQDSGSYTYQITFPMSILENRLVFRNVSRFEVSKRLPDYEECSLYVDNRLIITGKGTVTSVTPGDVKLQIIGGKSRIKYNSMLERHYIDEINAYDTVVLDTVRVRISSNFNCYKSLHRIGSDTDTELLSRTYVGLSDAHGPICAFNTTRDESNGLSANRIVIVDGTAYLWNPAVQPFLMYVLRKALAYEGYTIGRNDLDTEPWNRLVICSARHGTDIRLALPHWSVYTFIEEVRKLFNASFVFRDADKEVDIVLMRELTTNSTAAYEALDDFSVEHDDDGLKNIVVSNIAYSLADSENRSMYDVIPSSAYKRFAHLEFSDYQSMSDSFSNATTKTKMTTIYTLGEQEYIGVIDSDKYGDSLPHLTRVGFFSPLIRNSESDEYEEFSIVPVAMVRDKLRNLYCSTISNDQTEKDFVIEIPSIQNDKQATGGVLDGEDEEYLTVQEAMEDESLLESREEDKEEKMQVMFQMRSLLSTYPGIGYVSEGYSGDSPYRQHRYPVCQTGADPLGFTVHDEMASLSLHNEGEYGGHHIKSIGDFHEGIPVDGHNLQTIGFITDDIPDPSHIYVFRNKKYVCQKIEMEVDNNGIDRVKKGYFYELG